MKYLIDTNAWIAFFEDLPLLTDRAAEIMETAECFVSVASIWEAAIKVSIGKLRLPYHLQDDLPRLLEDCGFKLLPIEQADALGDIELPTIHRDPFDRLQLMQAQRRGYTMVSRDPIFDQYEIKRVW